MESMDQAAVLFTKMLCGSMFEAQANVVVGSKRSKSGTMIDQDKQRRMKDSGSYREPIFFLQVFLRSLRVHFTIGLNLTTH